MQFSSMIGNSRYRMILLLFFIFIFYFTALYSQPHNLLYENNQYVNYEAVLLQSDSIFHSSVHPYIISDIRRITNFDSLENAYRIQSFSKRYLPNLIFNRNLITFKEGDFAFTIDPLLDLNLGKDLSNQRNTWTNTRGILVEGSVGKKFAFSTRFYENQAIFPLFIDKYIIRRGVVPGQGKPRNLNGTRDYASASGYISYTPGKYFNFQLGHGKNSFGDGYRSLMLSDHALYYPYFKITSTIWRFKYINLYTSFNHPDNAINPGYNAYPRKYGTFHYLSFVGGRRWNLSLFEAIIWQAQDSTGYRGFDFNYLNPMIFYRPVEFTLSSPDNAFMGTNFSFKAAKSILLYTQFVIDEFRLSEIKAGNGWWANKYAWQAGIKLVEPFKLKNLYLQAEYNTVRPYMYSHYLTTQNYSHFKEPLAYSFGANTREFLFRGKYNYGRLYFQVKYNQAVFGLDSANINFGKNIFLNYQNIPEERIYGNYVAQGLETQLKQLELTLSFLVNPRSNLNLFTQYIRRKEISQNFDDVYIWFNFGIRTSLRNLYSDFY